MEKDRSLSTLLEEQARKYNGKIFLYCKDARTSYERLNELAHRIANGLRALKVRKGDKVCLLLPNRLEFVYVFFGALKLGAVVVPTNTLLKAEELSYIVRNSDAGTVVTTAEFMDRINAIRDAGSQIKHCVVIGEEGFPNTISFNRLLAASMDKLNTPGYPEDDAAIIYTSGTTGRPKGVVLTHRNYLSNARSGCEAMRMTEEDRPMCILPLFHVNGQVVTVLCPLYAGASMVLTEGFSPKTFFQDLTRYQATTFSGVPTIYSILLNLPDAEKYDLSSLTRCLCGAAPMPVEVFTRFEEKFNTIIIEGYGLSEGTCVSTANPIDGTRKIGSIGIPVPSQEVKIVDENDTELPVGHVGEIVVRGDNVMKEYYRNPEATAETLRNGWLHTGDLGYVDNDGYFYIVGRKKEMLIRGGENIYPKEIEEVLYKHPAIAEAAVVGFPDPIWGEDVAAFIVTKQGKQVSAEEVVRYCKEHLADFKCPRKVLFVDSLPKTATGKIQKGRLKDLFL